MPAKHAVDEHTPHPLDIALGARVRLRRKELGLSQDELARAIGLTFQQIQKYEHGTNRISFSRLMEIAEALECRAFDLIGDLDTKAGKAPVGPTKYIAMLKDPGALKMLETFVTITSPRRRTAVLNLAREMAAAK